MSKKDALACLCAAVAAGAAGYVRADELSAPPLSLTPVVTLDAAGAPAAPADWTDTLKKPAPWITWGADERMRIEYFDNAITLNERAAGHEWDFFRYRTRVWASISPCQEFTANVRLIWEGRHWQNPVQNNEHTGSAYKPEWDNGQGEFDTLNAKLTLAPLATTITAGRQDIVLGDGWLVLEGTPLDGSTSIYFDALRTSTQLKDIQTTVDLIYINQYSNPDMWLPTINDSDVPQIESNERGAILWITNKSIKNLEIDPYFIYKHDEAVLPIAKGGDNADIYTFGSRFVENFTPTLMGRVEVAGQFGDKNGTALRALGVLSRLDYSFNDTHRNELRFNFEYLSGDPRRGVHNEDKAFDPLWGRWPQFSELYIYTYAKETRIANTTNLLRFGPGYVVHPCDKAEIELDYNAMFAPQNTLAGTSGFTSGGNFRGHLFSAILRYKFDSHLAGHLWSEYLVPGNYYDDTRRDNAVYLRAEAVLTF